MHTDPVAYFITWTCYGTWLPGDDRGSTRSNRENLPPRPLLNDCCRDQMKESVVKLSVQQRIIVEQTIRDHTEHRDWQLHVANCRSNHCHVVVTAPNHSPTIVRDQLKSWCTRRLKESQRQNNVPVIRQRWWTRGGSSQMVFCDDSLARVVQYVREAQELGGSKGG